MVKKTKSKARLDKFYKIAKEQGYRSRASFKLIQLNKKYNFLQNATVVVDLCAAPGGWLQVASKYMSESSIIIGIDLDPIKPIKNVRTFQEDITTQKCVNIIKKEIQHMKVDVFLNDGAPNVGSNWNKDAYSQSELVLHALKLAAKFLKKGGIFVTKVFRSNDYHSLIWVFNKFFGKVDASKPEASRINSAEIFVVCQNYLAPDVIDPRFFDPTYVFKDSEADILDALQNKEVNSLKKVFEKKKRNLIADNTPLTMYKKIKLQDFIESSNPYNAFVECNEIDVSDKDMLKQYNEISPIPTDFEEMCKDIKLLNKKQVGSLVKWKLKIDQKLKKSQNDQMVIEKEENKDEVKEPQNDTYDYLKKSDKIEKKNKEKSIIKFVKNKLINNDAALTGNIIDSLNDFDFLKHKDIIKKGKIADVEEDEDIVVDPDEARRIEKNKKLNSYQEVSDNIEYLYEKKHKNKVKDKKRDIVDGIITKSQAKAKPELELSKKSDANNAQDFKKPSNEQVDISTLQQNSKFFDRDIFNVLKDQKVTQANVVEPEAKESDKEDYNSDKEDLMKEELDEDMHEYLEENFKDELREMDDDELAEILVLSKKMLRKKKRREIVDDAYNRYNYPEDPNDLPRWFYEDERKHTGKMPQVSKEEVEAEKQRLKVLKKRLPKKVMEAKARQKKRFFNTKKKANTMAEQIFESESLSGFTKAKQINDLYKKAAKKARPKKKEVIVARRHTIAAPRKKKGRKFMIVDKRQKKELRAEKNKKIKKRK